MRIRWKHNERMKHGEKNCRCSALLCGALATISFVSGMVVADSPFGDLGDLKSSHKNAIEFVANRGLMKGVTSDRFEPDRDVTRAELAIVVERIVKRFDRQLADVQRAPSDESETTTTTTTTTTAAKPKPPASAPAPEDTIPTAPLIGIRVKYGTWARTIWVRIEIKDPGDMSLEDQNRHLQAFVDGIDRKNGWSGVDFGLHYQDWGTANSVDINSFTDGDGYLEWHRDSSGTGPDEQPVKRRWHSEGAQRCETDEIGFACTLDRRDNQRSWRD